MQLQKEKIKSIKIKKFKGTVYNFSVKWDESYIANWILTHNCRSFWVEILMDEAIKPKITGVPKSINRDRTGYTNFQDLQKVVKK